MEIRKVQLTGKSTYTVSLPKKWVKEFAIKKGTSIGLLEKDDGRMIILPKASEEETLSEKTIHISKEYSASLISRLVIASYLNGYEIVKLSLGKGAFDKILDVKNVIKALAGIEILKENESEVVLKCLINEKDISIWEAIDRMSSLILQMVKDLKDRNRLLILESEIDKFSFLSLRLLRKLLSDRSQWERNNINNYQDILSLMHISDALEHLGDHILEMKSPSPDLEKDITETFDNIRLKDVEIADTLIKKLKDKIEKHKVITPYVRILGHLVGTLESIIDLSLTYQK